MRALGRSIWHKSCAAKRKGRVRPFLRLWLAHRAERRAYEHLADHPVIVVAVLALSGWGYGSYYRPAPVAGEVVTSPAWVSPLGIIGALAVIALMVLWLSGWWHVP